MSPECDHCVMLLEEISKPSPCRRPMLSRCWFREKSVTSGCWLLRRCAGRCQGHSHHCNCPRQQNGAPDIVTFHSSHPGPCSAVGFPPCLDIMRSGAFSVLSSPMGVASWYL